MIMHEDFDSFIYTLECIEKIENIYKILNNLFFIKEHNILSLIFFNHYKFFSFIN